MATKAKGNFVEFKKKTHKKRPGVHSKKKNSKLTFSKNYRKKYVGQGR